MVLYIILFLESFLFYLLYTSIFPGSNLKNASRAFVSSFSLILLTGIFLGVLGALSPGGTLFVLVLQVIFLGAALWIVDPALTTVKVLQTSLGSYRKRFSAMPIAAKGVIFVFSVMSALVVLKALVYGVVFPPFSIDGMNTHACMSYFYLQNQSVYLEPWYGQTLYQSRGPEILGAMMTGLDNSDLWLNTLQLVFLIAGIFPFAGILRRLGVRPFYSLLASLFMLFIPTMYFQTYTTYVDSSVLVLFVFCIYFIMDFKKTDFIFFLLSFFLLVNTKFAGHQFLLVFTVVIGLHVFKVWKWRPGWKYLSVVFVLTNLAFWGYWYNLVYYGNPIYPHQPPVVKTLFPSGYAEGNPYGELCDPETPEHIRKATPVGQITKILLEQGSYNYRYDTRGGGLGPVAAVFFWSGLLAFLLVMILQPSIRRPLFTILLLVLLFYLSHHCKYHTRYIFVILIPSFLGLGLFFQYMAGHSRFYRGVMVFLYIVSCTYTGFVQIGYDSFFPWFVVKEIVKNKRMFNLSTADLQPFSWHVGTRELSHFMVYSRKEPRNIMVLSELRVPERTRAGIYYAFFSTLWRMGVVNRVKIVPTLDFKLVDDYVERFNIDTVIWNRKDYVSVLRHLDKKGFKPTYNDPYFVVMEKK